MRSTKRSTAPNAVEAVEQSRECLLGLDVDPRRRLVQDEQLRLRCERLGDEGALLLPPRETHERPLGDVGKPDARDRLVDQRAVMSRHPSHEPGPRQAPGGHDLVDRGRCVEPELRSLREIAEREAAGKPVSRHAGQERFAGGGSLQAQDEAHERRLAPTVWAGDGDELSWLDAQVDVLEDRWTNRIGKGDAAKLEG
jgi:hypothetical protein